MIGPKVKIEDMTSERIIMEKQYSMKIMAKFTSRKRILCSETMLPSGLTEPKRIMAEIQNTADAQEEENVASYFEILDDHQEMVENPEDDRCVIIPTNSNIDLPSNDDQEIWKDLFEIIGSVPQHDGCDSITCDTCSTLSDNVRKLATLTDLNSNAYEIFDDKIKFATYKIIIAGVDQVAATVLKVCQSPINGSKTQEAWIEHLAKIYLRFKHLVITNQCLHSHPSLQCKNIEESNDWVDPLHAKCLQKLNFINSTSSNIPTENQDDDADQENIITRVNSQDFMAWINLMKDIFQSPKLKSLNLCPCLHCQRIGISNLVEDMETSIKSVYFEDDNFNIQLENLREMIHELHKKKNELNKLDKELEFYEPYPCEIPYLGKKPAKKVTITDEGTMLDSLILWINSPLAESRRKFKTPMKIFGQWMTKIWFVKTIEGSCERVVELQNI